jgi:hypothetical protein
MALESRIVELQAKHQRIEADIAEELKRPLTDAQRVQAMKRAKLRLKDEISALSRRH